MKLSYNVILTVRPRDCNDCGASTDTSGKTPKQDSSAPTPNGMLLEGPMKYFLMYAFQLWVRRFIDIYNHGNRKL